MNTGEWLIRILALTIVIDVALSNGTNLARPKVVGGYPIKIYQVPHLLALYHTWTGFICGGVILSPLWTMTALHCVLREGKDDPVKTHYVRVGSTLSNNSGRRHNIRAIYNYSSDMNEGNTQVPDHDIALIRLRDRIRFSWQVQPARLPQMGSEPPELLRVFGWGRTEHNDSSLYLLAANLRRVPYEDCIAAISIYAKSVKDERHLCYGSEQHADACYGDSGGPLGDSSTVYGIVSFGWGCGTYPGIYVRVSYYRDWINKVARI